MLSFFLALLFPHSLSLLPPFSFLPSLSLTLSMQYLFLCYFRQALPLNSGQVKLEAFKHYFLRILFLLVLLTCRERTREREREEGRTRREVRERTGKDNKREKVELIASEMEINQIILYANFVYQRKVKCENCLHV